MKTMATQMYINDVTGKSDEWRVKILVAEKSNVYTNKDGKRLQKLLLLDAQGNKVEGVLWNNNINILEGSLALYSTYIIGGAKVQPIKPGFQYATPGITTQWVLSRGTFVCPVTDEPDKIPYPPIQATFEDIHSLADTGIVIDIVAAVIDVKELRIVDVKGKLIPIRECTLVQNELRPIMLTLWGNLAEQQGSQLFALRDDMPIILCKGLRATSSTALSLCTIPFSFVSIDPSIPEVANLPEWLEIHLDDVSKIANKEPCNYLETTVKNRETLLLTQLSDIVADSKVAHSAVMISIVDIHQKVGYTTCPKCNQTQKALPNENFPCHTCKENHIATPHCKVVVELADQSRRIAATLFDKSADKLLSCTPEEAHNMDIKAMATHLEQINKKLKDNQIIAQIKAQQKKFSDNITRYTVQQWVESTESKLGATKDKDTCETDLPQKGRTISTTEDTTEAQTSAPGPETNTETSPTKKTNISSTSDNTPSSDTTSSPMKKMKIQSPGKN